jgi:Ca2+-binding EF-hand superfamily protein
MGHSERKSAVAVGLGLALIIFILSGCPQQANNPRVTIQREGGQEVTISLALAAGASVALQAQSTSSQDSIVWSSSAPDVAAVDASGRVAAIAPGTATILATGSASLASTSIEIVVSPTSSGGEGEGEGQDVLVQMTPFSGRFGYGLEGPYGFVGALTKQALTDPAWHLEGDFSFPTAGYMVSDPVVTVAESYPEQVYVAINVIPPTCPVPQVVTHVSITAEIPASNEAQFAIHIITQANPNPGEGEGEGEGQWELLGETSWIAGETSPPAWTIQPLNPTEADVICFSGPTQVYQNLCRALTTLGQGQLSVDRSSHRIQLIIFPVETFAACDDTRDPVCGIQGSFGPLEKGDWILYAVHANDPLANFNISFHVGSAEPGLDPHVKPIPDDADGDYLTDVEEQALGDMPNGPDVKCNEVPAGIQLARSLFALIDQLPICPAPPGVDANGTVSGITPPLVVAQCKTLIETDCIEKCSVCGEPYNCGFVTITIPEPADQTNPDGSTAGVELQASFAALHYMQHGSLSYKWKEGGYEGRVDVVTLARLLNPQPPPPPPDPMQQIVQFLLSADADQNGCLSFTEAQTIIPSIDQELFDLLANLWLNILVDGSWTGTPTDICPYAGMYAPPEVLMALFNKVVALADKDGDGSLSLEEVQSLVPGFPPELFALADQNGDGMLSVDDVPKPPPPDPLSELINLVLQADTDHNGCLSLAELQTIVPAMDENLFGLLKQVIDCSYIWLPMMDGTLSDGMPDANEICICGNFNLTPDLLKAMVGAVLAVADTDGDQALSFEEAQAYVPALTEAIFKFLDQNGDGVLSAVDIPEPPPPPPPDPMEELIRLLMGVDADHNGCLSFAEAQTAIPSIDQELFDLLARLCPNMLAGVSWTDTSAEICPYGGVYSPPEVLIPLIEKAVALADKDGDGMLSFDEVQALIPGLPPELFALLDQNGDGVLSAADIPELPPPPPPDPLSELIDLFYQADTDYDGCLSLAEFQTIVPAMDENLFELLKQAINCPSIQPGMEGTDPNGMPEANEICICGNINLTPDLINAIVAAVLAVADKDGDQALSFAEAQAYVPALTEAIFNFLDQNGDGVLSAADIPELPPPPPPDPLSELMKLFMQADTDNNGCLSLTELQTLVPTLDENLFGLLKQAFDCGFISPSMGGTNQAGGRAQIDEICLCGAMNLTPDLMNAVVAALLAAADKDGDQSLSFEEAQAYIPALTQTIFNFLDQNGDGVLSAADIPELPPPPPPDPLSELMKLFLQADTDSNGCLSLTELQTLVPTPDENLFGLLKQVFDCPYIGPGMNGTDPSGMPENSEICMCGNVNATPDLMNAVVAAVLTVADQDGDQALSFAEAQAYVPALTDMIFNSLDQNGDGVLSAADIPPPPVVWIANGQCPAQWTIDPPVATPATAIHFSGPTATFSNACEATSALGTPWLAIDPANQRIELMFDPLPGPVPCPMIYAPVCGLEGVFPPLKEGLWLFLCQNPEVLFQLTFLVQEPLPANRVEAQWISGETGPKDWAMEILPLGMPLNGIRIAGPTSVFSNECEGQAALGGRPFVCMDENAHVLTLLFDGPRPDACYDLWAPVCGLEARIIGIANGIWTFSVPTLIPPVQLTFTLGHGTAPNI